MGTWKRNSIVSVKFCPGVTCLQQSSQFANGRPESCWSNRPKSAKPKAIAVVAEHSDRNRGKPWNSRLLS
jgi:hypothetical protein